MATGSLIKQGVALVQEALTSVIGPGDGLTVLTARFLFDSGGTRVNLHLACGRRRAATDPKGSAPMLWDVPLAELLSYEDGIGPRLGASFVLDLGKRLQAVEGGNSSEPLWLKLARPYGMLGTAAWEGAIGQQLHRCVLRLPDFPERPARRPDVLESAVLVDPGPDTSNLQETVERVRALIRAILRGSDRAGTRVHVFCSASWLPLFERTSSDTRVVFHDPGQTMTAAEALRSQGTQRVPVLRSAPWSEWIADVMAARGIDAVFLLCRAQRTETGAELILSCSPSGRENESTFHAIDEEEICLLLNRAGAWLLTLLPDTPAQPQALAYVADSLAHRWPGATLFHPLSGPRGESALRMALKLLGADKPAPATQLGDGFLYCQPGFVRGARTPAAAASSLLDQGARLLTQRAPWAERLWSKVSHALPGVTDAKQSVPPNWIGSAQRFLESATFDAARKNAGDVLLGAPPETGDRPPTVTDPATDQTLRDIEDVVGNYVRTQKDRN